MAKLYFSKDDMRYYVQKGETCDVCNNEITEKFGFHRGFSKLWGGFLKIYCFPCFKSRTVIPQDFEEINIGLVTPELSHDAKLIVLPLSYSITDMSGLSTIDAVHNKTIKTINHTKISGRESIEGATIGAPIDLAFEEENKGLGDYNEGKTKEITLSACLKELDDLRNAKPIIPTTKQIDKPKDDNKQIEDKSEAQE